MGCSKLEKQGEHGKRFNFHEIPLEICYEPVPMKNVCNVSWKNMQQTHRTAIPGHMGAHVHLQGGVNRDISNMKISEAAARTQQSVRTSLRGDQFQFTHQPH